MGAYDLAEGPYKRYIELFADFKVARGYKGTGDLMAACVKISVALAGEEDCSGFGEEALRPLLSRNGDESDSTRYGRVSMLRQFCAFLGAFGIPCWQVPPRYLPAPKSAFRPYILSDADISAVLCTVDNLPSMGKHRAAGYEKVYPTLARLLLSSGLRIGEALSLDVGDFSPDEGVLEVKSSKNGVSRLVPLSGGMAERLRGFVSTLGRESGPLFMSPYTARAYTGQGIGYMFAKIYDAAGVSTPSGGHPRIHDMRHTFCTRSLDKMLASGMSVYEAVPILAAYVGHVNYVDTEKYIHLTRAGHGAFVAAEAALGAIVPKAVV